MADVLTYSEFAVVAIDKVVAGTGADGTQGRGYGAQNALKWKVWHNNKTDGIFFYADTPPLPGDKINVCKKTQTKDDGKMYTSLMTKEQHAAETAPGGGSKFGGGAPKTFNPKGAVYAAAIPHIIALVAKSNAALTPSQVFLEAVKIANEGIKNVVV